MVVLTVMFISLFLSLLQREITRKDCAVISPPCFLLQIRISIPVVRNYLLLLLILLPFPVRI